MTEQLDAGLIASQITEDDLSQPYAGGELGRGRRRKEDPKLLTGQTTWTDNITLPGLLHMAVLRSPMAHAKVLSVDVSPALEMPGVIAAYSGADLADVQGALPCAWPVTPDMVHPDHHPLAVDEVRHVGDGVAVVIARDRYLAADALEAILVEYEQLPAVVDMEEAIKEGSPLVHSDKGTNTSFVWPFASGDGYDETLAAHPDAVVVKRRFIQQRLMGSPMEPRAVVVAPIAAADEYTVYSATQIPHILRVMLALVTGIGEHKIRVIAPDVGGGFGLKLNVYAEEVLALVVAKKLGRPIKWTESRSEHYQATVHGRDQIQDIEIASTPDGTLLGLKVRLLADMGAYLQLVTPGVPILGAFMYPAIYKMKAYDFACTGVFTTKTPTDAYRGAGRPEATYAIERIMDELADTLGRDPMELRKQNWIKHEEFPYEMVAGLTYDSGNYEAATEKAEQMFGMTELRREQAERRERQDPVQLGIGISTFTEMCGLAPSRVLGSLSYGAGGWEAAQIRMLPTGKVEVTSGATPHGQGHHTAWSQIVADALGVPFEDIEVVTGDTDSSPKGMDTYGSRSLVVGGVAIHKATGKVLDKAKRIAAHLLEAAEGDLEFSGGTFSVKGSPEASLTIQEVALATFAAHNLPDGMEPTPGLGLRLRPRELQLSARHPPVRRRDRHRHGVHDDPQVRLRRRHRQDHQPGDRRGPGARRAGPGHRPGPVRGGGLRRRGQPHHRVDGRLPPPERGRPPALRHRPHRDPGHQQPARRQGGRRSRLHRLDARGHERRRRRPAPLGRERRRHAGHPRTGLAGHPRRRHQAGARGHRVLRRRVHRCHVRRCAVSCSSVGVAVQLPTGGVM